MRIPNFLIPNFFRGIYQILKVLEHEKDIVIFKGSGKAFCAGGDVKQFIGNTEEQGKEAYRNSGRTCDLLANYKKPYIALADGVAMGGASVYAQTGKYRIVTERTVFAMPETAIGYFNDAGASYFLPRLDNNLGFYLGMTGARLKGFDLKKVNLASHFIESSKMDELEKQLIGCKTHNEVQKVLNEFSTAPMSSASELDSLIPRIKKCFGGATVEEIYENLCLDGSDWAKNTIKVLNKMSPTSLKVVHRELTLGKTLSRRDCYRMEFRLVANQATGNDMGEGVRALLIDKDMKPKWNPKSLEEISDEHIEKFFGPTIKGEELTFETILPESKL